MNKIIIIKGAILLIPSLLFSNSFINKIHGSFGLETMSRTTNDSDGKEKETSFSKDIELAYADYIYSSRLIQYALNIKYSQIEESTEDRDSDNQQTEYSAKLYLLKKSSYPINISIEQSFAPNTIINSNTGLQETSFERNYFKLDGSIKLTNTFINYSIADNVNNVKNVNGLKDTNSNTYSLSLNKKVQDYTIQINLSNDKIFEDTKYDDLNKRTDTINNLKIYLQNATQSLNLGYATRTIDNDIKKEDNEKVTDIEVDYKLKVNDNISIGTNYFNTEDTDNESKNELLNISLRAELSKHHETTSTININKYEDAEDEYSNNSIYISSNYDISTTLSTSQSISYYESISNDLKSDSYSLDFGAFYARPIYEMSTLKIDGYLSLSESSSTSAIDTSESESDTTYSYNITTGITNNFEENNSILDYDINYHQKISQSALSEERIRLTAGFKTDLNENLHYIADSDYTIRNQTSNSSSNSGSKSQEIIISNKLQYNKKIDVRGDFQASAGLRYRNKSDNKDLTEDSLDPNVSGMFMYRLWRTLSYKSNVTIISDNINETTNYLIKSGLYYRYRFLSINLETNYNKQKGTELNSSSQSDIMLNIKRTF